MLSSNVESSQLPFQSWKIFKEAFAPAIVRRAFSETRRPIENVIDPFGGSGTTALTSQFLGAHPTTIEVNPFLCDLIESKLTSYNVPEVVESYASILDLVHRSDDIENPSFFGAPKTFVEPGHNGRFLFSRHVAGRILSFRNAIDKIENSSIRRLFRVFLAATAVSVSNVVISGKGRRYRKNWETRTIDPYCVDNDFTQRALSAINDISRYRSRPYQEYTLISGDARLELSTVDEFDLAVFSPPYPNSFDYTDVYNIELWILGYFSSATDNRNLRESTLRSHVQIKRDFSAKNLPSRTLTRVLSGLDDVRDKLWNVAIPDMVAAYFSDVATVISDLSAKLKTRGRIYAVVGDSRYASVNIPTADILDELSEEFSLVRVAREQFRSMRSSPQQGGRKELPESLLVFEKT